MQILSGFYCQFEWFSLYFVASSDSKVRTTLFYGDKGGGNCCKSDNFMQI